MVGELPQTSPLGKIMQAKRGVLDFNVSPIQWIPLKKGFGSNLPRWLAAPATLSKVQAVKGNEVQARQRRPLYSASTAQ